MRYKSSNAFTVIQIFLFEENLKTKNMFAQDDI
jgi:hypothetical protein